MKRLMVCRESTPSYKRWVKDVLNRNTRRSERALVQEQLDEGASLLPLFEDEPYTMVKSTKDEVEPLAPLTEVEVFEVSQEVLDLFNEEAPLVNVRREETYWNEGLWDEVNEQDWVTSLLLTDPRVLTEKIDRW